MRTLFTKSIFTELNRYPELLKLVNRAELANYALELGKKEDCPVKNRRGLYNIYNMFHAPLGRKRVASTSKEFEDREEKPKKAKKK